MAELISEECPRIKFKAFWEGQSKFLEEDTSELINLANLQEDFENLGVIPILNDGLVGGNCAMRTRSDVILVSKSGKKPLASLLPEDFVEISTFDHSSWQIKFKSIHESVRPSSDSPLHIAALSNDACKRYGWERAPCVALHGHALAEGKGLEAAIAAGMPVSPEITLFSTPDDLEALETLFTSHKYRYPTHRCYIRRGHGFFLLADRVEDACKYFESIILPLISKFTASE